MSFRDRARAIGRSAASPKSTIVQGIAGVLAYYGHKLASENISFVRENFWVGPLALGVGGHLIKRSNMVREAGAALVGAGGYALAMGFALDQAKSQQEAKGLMEVGAVYSGQLPGNMSTATEPELSEYYPTGATTEVSPSAYSIGR